MNVALVKKFSLISATAPSKPFSQRPDILTSWKFGNWFRDSNALHKTQNSEDSAKDGEVKNH